MSVDRLIEDLWQGEAPPRATASLQVYVSNLRRALEPGRAPRSPAQLLVSAPPGYAVRGDTEGAAGLYAELLPVAGGGTTGCVWGRSPAWIERARELAGSAAG